MDYQVGCFVTQNLDSGCQADVPWPVLGQLDSTFAVRADWAACSRRAFKSGALDSYSNCLRHRSSHAPASPAHACSSSGEADWPGSSSLVSLHQVCYSGE